MLLAPSESAALSVKMASMSKLGETTPRELRRRVQHNAKVLRSSPNLNHGQDTVLPEKHGGRNREFRGCAQNGVLSGLRSPSGRWRRFPGIDSAAPQNFSALGATARGRGARWNIGDYPETYEGTTPRQGTSRRPRPDLARSPSFGGFERLAALRVTTDVLIPRFLDAPSPPAPMMAHPAAGAARLELYNFYTITRVNASQVKSIGFPK